jgi:hypothetical protein
MGTEVMMHSTVLLRSEVASLQKANDAATQRKKHKKKQIQKQETLTRAEGLELIAQADVDVQIEGKECQNRKRARVDVLQ